MIDAVVGARYAKAIYALAEEDKSIDKIYEELNSVMEIYEFDKEFRNFVDHPLVKRSEKREFVAKIFSENFGENTLNILEYLVEKNRLSYIRSIVAEYLKIYYAKNSIVEAEATFAIEPSTDQVEKLLGKLEKRTNKKVKLKTRVDKTILGGIVIRIEDEIIDASVKRELEAFRNNY